MLVKQIAFLADSLQSLRLFPAAARQQAGYQLEKVQRGEQPSSFKPFSTIGPGVEELRIRDASGAYRVIYTARLADAIYVLHAFQKKTEKTAQRDIDVAKARYAELMRTIR